MTSKRTLVLAAVVLAGLILAAGAFLAFIVGSFSAPVLTPRQLTVSVEGSMIPIEKEPNTSQPSSGELQAAARVAVEFLNADVAGCQAARAAWLHSRDYTWKSELALVRIRPYVTERVIRGAEARGPEACSSVSHIEVSRITSGGWVGHWLRLVADSLVWFEGSSSPLRRMNIMVLLVHQPDGWKVDDVGLA